MPVKPRLTRQGKTDNRIAMMAMAGVGKTTAWGAAITASQQHAAYNNRFFTDINAPPKHPILKASALFRACRYPPKTEKASRAEIWSKWSGFPGLPPKEVKIGVVEIDGEQVRAIVDSYNVGGTGGSDQMSSLSTFGMETVQEYLLKSKNFIIMADLSRSPLYSGWEEEIGEEGAFPDEDCRDIIQSIQQYKKDIEGASYEPNFCVLFSKWDKVRLEFTTKHGMDLYTTVGMEKFLAQGFSLTANKLNYMQNPNNIYLPIFVEAVQGSKDRMMMNPKTKLPFYSETSFIRMLEWIRKVA